MKVAGTRHGLRSALERAGIDCSADGNDEGFVVAVVLAGLGCVLIAQISVFGAGVFLGASGVGLGLWARAIARRLAEHNKSCRRG